MIPGEGGIILEEPFILYYNQLHHLGQGTAHRHVQRVVHGLAFPYLKEKKNGIFKKVSIFCKGCLKTKCSLVNLTSFSM